jgi:hypothetical protein
MNVVRKTVFLALCIAYISHSPAYGAALPRTEEDEARSAAHMEIHPPKPLRVDTSDECIHADAPRKFVTHMTKATLAFRSANCTYIHADDAVSYLKSGA